MLTTERCPFTILWVHHDDATGIDTPARVDPNEPLEWIFDPVGSGTVEGVVTEADGRSLMSTMTRGYVSAGAPAASASVTCNADADLGTGKRPITVKAIFDVVEPELEATGGTFMFGPAEPKPAA